MTEFKLNDAVRPKGKSNIRMIVIRQEGDSVSCRIEGVPGEKPYKVTELELIPRPKAIPPLRPTFG